MLDGVLRQIVRESKLAKSAMTNLGKLGVDGKKTARPETFGDDAARWFRVAHEVRKLVQGRCEIDRFCSFSSNTDATREQNRTVDGFTSQAGASMYGVIASPHMSRTIKSTHGSMILHISARTIMRDRLRQDDRTNRAAAHSSSSTLLAEVLYREVRAR